MTSKNNIRHNLKDLPGREQRKSDIYISYNSLSQTGDVNSVSESMHKYIKEGFAKLLTKKNNKT